MSQLALTAEAFSLSHAAILNGTTGAEEVNGDIYGVSEASLEPSTDDFDNEGDDTILSVWQWVNYLDISVVGGYIPFELIALLSGEPISSEGADPTDQYHIEPWTSRSSNVAPRPMLIRMPSKDAAGRVRTLEFVLYKVQFAPITFDGPAYKDGLKINYTGRALFTNFDETGTTIGSYNSIGRLISKQ